MVFLPRRLFLQDPLAGLTALVLGGLAAMLAWRRNPTRTRAALYALTPMLALGLIYGGATMAGRLNIGIRHWLPVFPLVFIVAGLAVKLPWPRFRLGAITLLVAWAGFDAWRVRDHPLAFVNPFGGARRTAIAPGWTASSSGAAICRRSNAGSPPAPRSPARNRRCISPTLGTPI
ncbi:MAG: hypothetical protein Q8N18_12940 [Opitutaceae bacterium]|nr:hypothetical protein [Opitutaceae bacterium]